MYTDLSSINKFIKYVCFEKPKAMLLAFVFCVFIFCAKGQVNLVPNPSFESVIGFGNFPCNCDYVNKAVPWDSLKAGGGGGSLWKSPGSDAYCFQIARTGLYFAGLNYYATTITPWRSYIQVPLTKTLSANKSYCVTGFFNLRNDCQNSIDELSFYFDDGTIASAGYGQVALANPQIQTPAGIFYLDTLNWMKAQGTFVAIGKENYITLGNHKPQSNLTFSLSYLGASNPVTGYNVDDISVIEADLPAYAGRDTVLCTGDSVFIGRPPEIGLECLWFNNGSQIATGGGLWVKPTVAKTYVVQQDVCGLIKTATVQVQVKPKYNGNPVVSSNSIVVCPTDTIKFNIQNAPAGNSIKYDWLPTTVFTKTANLTAKSLINQTTTFTTNIHSNGEDAFCPFLRTSSVTITVPVYNGPANLVSDQMIVCPADTVNFSLQNAPAGNNIKYTWLPQAAYTTTNNFTAKSIINQVTSFTLNVNSPAPNGFCSFSRTANVTIADSCFKDPVIPNIFTPNNDEVNDEWKIKFPLGYSLLEMQVYNRWGTLIFELNNLSFNIQNFASIGWDGRTSSGEECSAGVYFYVVRYSDRNNAQKISKGNLTLIK